MQILRNVPDISETELTIHYSMHLFNSPLKVNKLLEAERSGKKGLASAEDRAAALFGALQTEEKERDAELQGSLGDLAGLNTEAAEAMGEAKAGMTKE